MDWFSWLSKTGLEPSLVYEYGLSFAHNELEEDDIAYFNHEFLQSIGISIAKHRLEILKLARKEKGLTSSQHAIARFVVAIKRTKRSLSNHIKAFIHHDKNKALVLVPNRPQLGYGDRWRAAMMKRNNKLLMGGQQGKTLLLTNGRKSPKLDGFSSPLVYDLNKEEQHIDGGGDDEDDDGYWSTGVQEIRWETMFQNLKPT